MSKHTPGPWRIGDAGKTVFGPKTEEPTPVMIVSSPVVTPRVGMLERRANIRLIAAAPELLVAAQAAIVALDGYDIDAIHAAEENAFYLLSSAVSKAIGESQ